MQNTPFSLENKVALVTGFAEPSGFAWDIARHLNAAGARVIASAHPRLSSIAKRNLTRQASSEVRKHPWGCGALQVEEVIACDVEFDVLGDIPHELREHRAYRDKDVSIQGLVESIQRRFDGIDIVVHSIGYSPEGQKSQHELSRSGYLQALSVSAFSLTALYQQLSPLLSQGASFIALSYLASQRSMHYYSGGMASAKAALESDARQLAFALGRKGQRINIISPGPYPSRAASSLGDIQAVVDHVASKSLIPKPVSGDDVGQCALFLAAPASKHITGQCIYIDGGYNLVSA